VIAVSQSLLCDREAIHEGAVVTLQVFDVKTVTIRTDEAVTA